MNYHEKEEELFRAWKEVIAAEENITRNEVDELFSDDGLLHRGIMNYSKSGYWYRDSGDEESLWSKAPTRVLFLTKDLNDTEAWDIREETRRSNHSGGDYVYINTPFYKNYMWWFYGLLSLCDHHKLLSYAEANQQDRFLPFFESNPVVRVNCKKRIGGGTLAYSTLQSILLRDKDYIVKQLDIYDADIIFCCGGSSALKNFVGEYYITDLKCINSWMFYSDSQNKLVVDSYHSLIE